jgi:hypothetical protein
VITPLIFLCFTDLHALLQKAQNAVTRMDGITIFGLVAVTLMLVFYALEDRSPHFILAFAFACWMGSAYGFLQGAWPFGLVEGIWGVVAMRGWIKELRQRRGHQSVLYVNRQ